MWSCREKIGITMPMKMVPMNAAMKNSITGSARATTDLS